ncbi:MAG: ABC transporter ATP-binding protein, partial [Anaerolineaceae bacterium]
NYGKVRALNEIDLSIQGGMFGLLGPNGSGKTTLMRIISTLLPLSTGAVHVGPYDVTRQPQEIRQRLGYIPQSFGFYKSLTAIEMLDYIAAMKNLSAHNRSERITSVIDEVNLTEVARRKIGTYSGGMIQRLGIAQALLGDPQILIVDEPTAGLDPEERVRFRNLFASLAEKRTVVLSTHIVADIEASCSALAVICQGSLIFSGQPQEMQQKARGQVWSMTINSSDFPDFADRYQVISSRQTDHQVSIRLLSQQQPGSGAVLLEPDLEDGYLALLATHRQEVQDA